MRILYVEDDQHDADLTRRELARSGPQHTLETVPTVGEARERLEEQAGGYDLVLIDLRLADADGMSLLRSIRKQGLPLAVVIVTGRGDEEAAVAALKAGADDYVIKREEYLERLPLTLEDALHRFRARASRRARPLRVVYAEHSATDVDLTRRHLARHASHIHLDVVHTGAEVLRRVAEASGDFDVLLLDYNLPGMNALEVLKEVRQRQDLDVPVVLVTGRGGEDVAVEALRLGAADYVVKNPGYLHRLPAVLEGAFHRTELARERAALRESEQRYRSIFNGVQDAIFVESLSGEILDVNERACEMFGYTREELVAKTVDDLVAPGALALVPEELSDRTLLGRPIESVNVRANGERFPVEVAGQLQEVGGETVLLVVVRDVTARKRAEDELRSAEREKETILDSLVEHVVHQDREMRIVWANKAACESVGMTREELLGRHCYEVWPDRDDPCPDCPVIGAMETGELQDVEKSTPDGRAWYIRGYPVRDEAGNVVSGIEVTLDITGRRRAEASLRRHADRLEMLHAIDRAILEARSPERTGQAALGHLRRLVPSVAAAVVTFDVPLRQATLFAVDAAEGFQLEAGTNLPLAGVTGDVELLREGEVFSEKDVTVASEQPPAIRALETAGIRSYIIAPMITQGKLVGALGLGSEQPEAFAPKDADVMREVADQLAVALHQARLGAALETERRRLETTVNHAPQGIVLLDGEQRILLANPTAQEALAFLAGVGEGERLERLAGRALEGWLSGAGGERRHVLNAHGRAFELVVRPIGEEEQEAEGWVMLLDDVTEERQEEAQVQRQERLAAMGQLAGGIAHDFRNFLSSILLYADMAARHPDLPPALVSSMRTIVSESEQASGLVQQILDFSRRSMMTTQPLDLKPFVKEVVRVLERTIPESISVVQETGPGRYVVDADPTRIQQVVMNLALNARDAMPGGGELRVSLTRPVVAPDGESTGDDGGPQADRGASQRASGWICLAVSDTGMGITEEVRAHLFEPFFTTKASGTGTGLGLAQVHGIVEQHEGHIEVETEVGVGSTFRVYLPAHGGDELNEAETEARRVPKGRGESILVVEDEARVREAVRSMLVSLDYEVMAAANGREALELCRIEEPALVVTDLVMPQMGGRDLVEALRRLYPRLKTVVMTGYALNGDLEGLQVGGVAGVIEKPFDPYRLAQLVRRVLDR